MAIPAFLAVRSGALLLGAAHPCLPEFGRARVVLWQPVLDGARFLQQFLRLRVIAERVAGSSVTVQRLEQQMTSAGSLEIAGYTLGTALAAGIGAARLASADLAAAAAVRILEFKAGSSASLSAPVQQLVSDLVELQRDASAVCVPAEQFWTTQEISAPWRSWTRPPRRSASSSKRRTCATKNRACSFKLPATHPGEYSLPPEDAVP